MFKRFFYSLFLAGCTVGAAQAASVIIDLPDSQNLTQTSSMGRSTGQDLLNKLKTLSAGIYAGGNNNSISNWPQNGEGTWVWDNSSKTGSITLCGRTGVNGDSFGLVFDTLSFSDPISSFTLTCTSPTSVITKYSLVLGVYNSSGELITTTSSVTQDFSFSSAAAETTTTTLTFDTPLEWKDEYKLVAGIHGGPGTATSAYTITGIQLSYTTEVIPEPATAGLSLLGLFALAARRRRA